MIRPMMSRLFVAAVTLCLAALALGARGPVRTRAPFGAGGDGCFAPPTIGLPLPFQDSGDTTGAVNDVNEIPATCASGYQPAYGPDHVYAFEVVSGNSLTFTVTTTSTTYDPMIYVVGACNDGATCVSGAFADDCGSVALPQPGCGGAATESIGPITLPVGVYYLYVDSAFSTVTQPTQAQGPYELTVTGTVPVELLRFEVE